MKCIIYGLGSGRLRVERYLKSNHEIIGYSDSYYQESEFNNKKFYKPEQLNSKEIDIIIIAIGSEEIRKNVCSELISYGVDKKKILDFYLIYVFKYQRYLNTPFNKIERDVNKEYDGVVLGISHAVYGINIKCLNGEFCNLADSAQDLFYNLRMLQIAIEKYGYKFKNTRYAIIDMHKYTYFNYDVSLSKRAIIYYNGSRFRSDDCHNFKHNKNYSRSIEEEITKFESELGINNTLITLFNEVFEADSIDINRDFNKSDALHDFSEYIRGEKEKNKSITINDIEKYKKNCKPSSIQTKRFENTIKENIEIFDILMKTLKEINSKIKIYIVLIPQHKIVEEFEQKIEESFKKEFYDILNVFKKKYDFRILDFINNEEISSRNDYYYDMGHLNYNGATAFTKLLNSYIEYEK